MKVNTYRRIKRVDLLKLLLVMIAFGTGISGFQLLLLGIHAAGLGHSSRLFTVPFRAGFLIFSLFFIVYGISNHSFSSLGKLWIPLITFWLLYFLRILFDGYLYPSYLTIEPIQYIQKAIGVTFIPMIIFLVHLGPRENKWSFRIFWIACIGCILFALFSYRNILGQTYRHLQYMGYDSAELISPIILSYIGAVVVSISFQLLIMSWSIKISKIRVFSLCVILGIGLVKLFLGGTRSALIACIATCTIVFIKSMSKAKNISRKVLIISIAIFITFILAFIMDHFGSSTINRLDILREQLISGSSEAGGGRLQLYQNTLRQIVENPLWGSGLEEKTRGSYPHNHFLEAFMATGILGGISFIVLVWTALKRCLLILQYHTDYAWIAILFLVFFLRGLFSSPIIESSLWYSMMAVFAVPVNSKNMGAMYG